jgi:YVTN family beta-propeller protein
MQFRILGSLEVLVDGRAVDLGGAKQRALLAVLLLSANRVVSTDQLIEALWGERVPDTALKAVRVYVSQLRKALDRDRILTATPGYKIRIEPGELDLERFQALVAEGKPADALSLWRGRPLADFAYEPFAQSEIARLEELQVGAIEARIEADLEAGRSSAVVGELEALVREHPLKERLWGHLMLALYRSGRQADALDAYRRARQRLVEVGIEPGPQLRELERKILTQDESLAPPSVPGSTALSRRRRTVALAAAALVLVALAASAFLALRESGGSADIPANAVGLIDPRTNDVVASIPVGLRPGPLATGAGLVWVGNLQDRSLTRIDADQRAVLGTVSLQDRTPTGLAVGGGAVWVAHGLRGELSQVEPQFGRQLRTITVAGRSPTGSVAVGAGYVWAAFGDSTLARIRPGADRPDGTALTGAIPAGVAVTGRSVWVVNSGDATVQRFDVSTYEEGAVRPISVGRRPAAIAMGEGAVWVANRGDDTVTRIDPSTSSTFDIRVGDEPAAIAVGGGAVWVANSGDGTVSRIDPATNEVVRSFDVGSTPAGIVVAAGLVWVAAQAP